MTPDPLDAIHDLAELERVVLTCRRCALRAGCSGVVFGEGNPRARVMFIGEGPGADEDRLGRPFVGRAGQLLDKMLQAAGFAREDVYIANVVKCRPPDNRTPTPEEREACWPNLRSQIRLILPKIIVLLGATALQQMFDPKAKITQLRGQWLEKDGMRMLPTFHPAALLRSENLKQPAWEDFKKVREAAIQVFLEEARAG